MVQDDYDQVSLNIKWRISYESVQIACTVFEYFLSHDHVYMADTIIVTKCWSFTAEGEER